METAIKLNEKKDRDKRYIKNWRPIFLLNVDTKILSIPIKKSCFANVNFLTTNCLCKKQIYWRKC